MESDSRDQYEADNLVWQLDITFKKLSEICKKNGKLVDHINKKVVQIVSEWNDQKDEFKKLSWAEMDDSDLDLDLDITLSPSLQPLDGEVPITPLLIEEGVLNDKHLKSDEDINDISHIDDAAADADPNPFKYETTTPTDYNYYYHHHHILNNEGARGYTNNNNNTTEMQQTVVALINAAIQNHKDTTNDINLDIDDDINDDINDINKTSSKVINKNKEQSKMENKDISSTYFALKPTEKKSTKLTADKKRNNNNNNDNKHKKVNDSSTKHEWSTITSSSKKKKKMMKGKLMFVRQKLVKRKKKMEETEKFELAKAQKKKEKDLLRMKRAEKRKQEQHKMMKQKNKKLNSKLKEIKLNDNMEKENMYNAIKQRQIKAEQKKQKIKKEKKKHVIKVNKKLKEMEKANKNQTKEMEANLNKRFQNAANKRHQNQLIRSRRNSLSISASISQSHEHQLPLPLIDEPGVNVNDGHDGVAGDEEIKIDDETKYFDNNLMTRLSGKFLYIPRVVRKSSSSNLYCHIELLYKNTNRLLLRSSSSSSKNLTVSSFEDILRIWSKNTNDFNFKDRKHDKDVLLVINRFVHFDINTLEVKCARLFIKNLISLTRNKIGLELLSYKYALKLLIFYKKCLNEYIYKNHNIYKSVIPQLSVLLVRMFQNTYNDYPLYKNDKDYKKFKKSTASFLLLNLYKSSFLIKISSIFKSMAQNKEIEVTSKVLDGILNVLMQIPLILKKHNNVNGQICDLINTQIELTNCFEIINFIDSLIIDSIENPIDNNKRSLSNITKCFQFSTNILNSNHSNKMLFNKMILRNKAKIYHILSSLFEYINIHFTVECGHIFEAAKSMLDFITFSTMNHKEIQDIYGNPKFDNNQITLLHRLCNIPFYFMLQKQGQNVYFPALISCTYHHEKNLNLMKCSLNSKHLQLWLKRNIYSDIYKEAEKDNKNKNEVQVLMQKEFVTKIPSKMWSNCLHFYDV